MSSPTAVSTDHAAWSVNLFMKVALFE